MTEEVQNAEDQVAQAEGSGAPKKQKKKMDKKKKWTITGVVVGVVVIAIAGMWIWHGSPSFCNNTICHASMDSYVQSYYAADNAPATDKWGNEVSDSHAMLAVSHASAGKACLDCHVPSVPQQLNEVGETITGNYYLPLDEQDVLSLRENAGQGSDSGLGDEFCMNDSCHSDLTREKLTQKTAGLAFNPHAWQHEQNKCSDCHKSHRASELLCTKCHEEAKQIMPEGWVDANTADQLHEAIYNS